MNSGPTGSLHLRADDPVDLPHRIEAQCPSHHLLDRIELCGMARAPQSGGDARLVERPSQRQMDHAPAEIVAREAIELAQGAQVARVARRLEFWIAAAKVTLVE